MSRFSQFIIVALFLLVACSPEKVVTSEALQAYATDADNGLYLEEETGNGLLASAAIRPSDLMAWQEWQTSQAKPWDSLRVQYGQYLYLIFSISAEGKDVLKQLQGTPMYAELLQILSFRMGEYASLHLSDGESLPIADAMYSRTYGLASGTSVLLAFEKPENLADLAWLELRIKELGLKTGTLKFQFESQDLLNIPELVLHK